MIRSYILSSSLLILLFVSIQGFSQVGINQNNPDPSSLLDLTSGDKGLLIPRMTTIQRNAIVNKANSLLVFDTDLNLFFYYNAKSSKWLVLNPWKSQGNTDSDIDSTNGKVVIGNSITNADKLEVNGNIKSNGDIVSTGSVISNAISTKNITTTNISSTGTVSAAKFSGDGIIPTGGIIMWSGTVAPAGWHLCNGDVVNGYATPNLKGQFIVGFDPHDGDYNAIGKQAGEKTHSLSIAEMPSHNHLYDDIYQGDQIVGQNSGANSGETAASLNEVVSANRPTQFTGGNGSQFNSSGLPHENRPPYYTLAYIIKLP